MIASEVELGETLEGSQVSGEGDVVPGEVEYAEGREALESAGGLHAVVVQVEDVESREVGQTRDAAHAVSAEHEDAETRGGFESADGLHRVCVEVEEDEVADGLEAGDAGDGVVLVVEQAQTVLALEEATLVQGTSVEVETLGIGVARRAEAVDDGRAGLHAALRDEDAVAGSVPGRGRGRARRRGGADLDRREEGLADNAYLLIVRARGRGARVVVLADARRPVRRRRVDHPPARAHSREPGGRGARARVHTVETNIRSMRRGGSRPGVRVRERHLTRAGAAAGDAPRRLNRRGQSWHAEASRDRSSGHPLPSGLAEHIKAAHFEVFRTAGKAFQYKASSHLTTRRARFTGRRRADAAARDSSARGCTLARGVSSSRRAPPPGVSSRARRVSSSRPVHG